MFGVEARAVLERVSLTGRDAGNRHPRDGGTDRTGDQVVQRFARMRRIQPALADERPRGEHLFGIGARGQVSEHRTRADAAHGHRGEREEHRQSSRPADDGESGVPRARRAAPSGKRRDQRGGQQPDGGVREGREQDHSFDERASHRPRKVIQKDVAISRTSSQKL